MKPLLVLGGAICISFLILSAIPTTSFAHGVAGQRFFPTTFAVDDPFVSDEFSVLYNFLKVNDEAGGPRTQASYENPAGQWTYTRPNPSGTG